MIKARDGQYLLHFYANIIPVVSSYSPGYDWVSYERNSLFLHKLPYASRFPALSVTWRFYVRHFKQHIQ